MLRLRSLMREGRFALALLGSGATAIAWAHPHAWIDVGSTVVLSGNGMVTAIEEEWQFDELYTTYVVEEMAGGRKPSAAVVAGFAPKVLENLGPYGYFMKVRQDGRPVSIAPVTQYRSEMRDERLVLRFSAPLAQPVDPVRHTFEFSVYDPTYFIEMLHDPKKPPVFRGEAPGGCRLEVRKPKPDALAIARAFSLDKGAPADDTLGQTFAEKVVVTCQ